MHLAKYLMCLFVCGLICFLVFLPDGCKRNTQKTSPKNSQVRSSAEDRAAKLARELKCDLLGQEISKAVGTNFVHSIDIQRVLTDGKRLVATARLQDLVEAGGKIIAVFEIDDFELSPRTCVAKLDCPTNLFSRIGKDQLDDWLVAFQVREKRHTLNFTKRTEEGDDSVAVSSVILIEGELLGLEKEY